MKSKQLMSLALLVVVLTFGGPAFAHHGATAYANNIVILKEVTVTKFVWANPHCIITFDLKDDHGAVIHWAGEAGSPAALSLLGWTKGSVGSGDVISVYLYPAKSGSPVGRLNGIMLGDGTKLMDSQQGGDTFQK